MQIVETRLRASVRFNVRIADTGKEDEKEAFIRLDEVNKLSLFLSKCFAKQFIVLEFHRLVNPGYAYSR